MVSTAPVNSELQVFLLQQSDDFLNSEANLATQEFFLEDAVPRMMQAFAESECYSMEYRNPFGINNFE